MGAESLIGSCTTSECTCFYLSPWTKKQKIRYRLGKKTCVWLCPLFNWPFFVAKKLRFLVIWVRFLDIAVFLCVGVHSRGSLNQLCAGSAVHDCDIKLTHQITFLLCAASLAFKDRLVFLVFFFVLGLLVVLIPSTICMLCWRGWWWLTFKCD